LPEYHGPGFSVSVPHRRVGPWQVMLEKIMQARQRIIGHHREHVMFNMVIHVPIDPPTDRIYINRSRVQAMVKYIVSQANVLQEARHIHMPTAINARGSDQHQRQKRPEIKGSSNRHDIDQRATVTTRGLSLSIT
jgi:hypothetical protein